jgi:hypothetical protein
MLKKSSPLKLLDQMEPNLAGSIYVFINTMLRYRISFYILYFNKIKINFYQQIFLGYY